MAADNIFDGFCFDDNLIWILLLCFCLFGGFDHFGFGGFGDNSFIWIILLFLLLFND